ncbi:MAG: amidohydrolase family protein [Nocardioidaceae bacterium]
MRSSALRGLLPHHRAGPRRRHRASLVRSPDAGARLTLGSDSHAVIDMHEEMRAVELDERLGHRQRGHWQSHELLTAATETGHRSLGFADAGRIAPGQWADLVTIDASTPRTAGTGQRRRDRRVRGHRSRHHQRRGQRRAARA